MSKYIHILSFNYFNFKRIIFYLKSPQKILFNTFHIIIPYNIQMNLNLLNLEIYIYISSIVVKGCQMLIDLLFAIA